jgi:hypothetical protein
LSRPSKLFNFIPNHVDTTGVGGVEFQCHGGVGRGGTIHSFGGGDDGGCLAWRD